MRHTLHSLSTLGDGEEFSFAFRNFLDAFYADADPSTLALPPAGNDGTRNAYLAATCDFLCNKFILPKPHWLINDSETFVADPPYFASTFWKTRIWLLADSPQEFRQRNIFVGADSLTRA